MKKLLILGVNGFIGHHLSEAVLRDTDWHVYGMDLESDRVAQLLSHPRFHYFEGDITINREWVEYHIRKCDVLLPLVAIATPATYISDPLRVFELDFEANLPLIRQCVKYRKRVVFPSTSEIYGMSADREFHPYDSNLVLGPIPKSRWIYSCSKQLLDRVIWAYGEQGLDFTLFRLAELANEDPSLRARQPYKAAIERDYRWLGDAMVKHYRGDEADLGVLLAAVRAQVLGSRIARPVSTTVRNPRLS